MPKRTRSLPLHEEVALLALKNDRGTVAGGVMYAQAAGGAILAELVLSGYLTTEGEGKKAVVIIAKPGRTGNEVLDECLEKIATAKRRARLVTWVQRFGGLRKLHHRVAQSLVDKAILREDEGKILFIFTRRIYPELDPTVEQDIRSRVQTAIDADTAAVDPRPAALIAIAHVSGLLKTNFEKPWLKARKARIEAIAKGEAVGAATRDAVAAVQGAIMAATIAATVAATSTSN